MDSLKSLASIIAALCISAGLLGSTVIASQAFLKAKAQENTLSVTGSTEQIVRSDTAKWTGNITRNVALDKMNEGGTLMKADVAAVMKIFTDRGIKKEAITIQPMTMNVVCESSENVTWDYQGGRSCAGNKTIGYMLSQAVIVESSDIDSVTKLAQETPEQVLAKGITFASQAIEYYYNGLADLRIEMLAKATENAKLRAAKIAESSGSTLGPVQAASMGVFQVTAKNSVDVSDSGAYDTSSIEKKVTAVVRASFQME